MCPQPSHPCTVETLQEQLQPLPYNSEGVGLVRAGRLTTRNTHAAARGQWQ